MSTIAEQRKSNVACPGPPMQLLIIFVNLNCCVQLDARLIFNRFLQISILTIKSLKSSKIET